MRVYVSVYNCTVFLKKKKSNSNPSPHGVSRKKEKTRTLDNIRRAQSVPPRPSASHVPPAIAIVPRAVPNATAYEGKWK
jgi:hypothetical protein